MREFNTTGNCMPEMHYMVDISSKISQIADLVEKRKYFTINRARQYGKTTTLDLLEVRLSELGYTVAYLSFEGLDDGSFATPEAFCYMFMEQISEYLEEENWLDESVINFTMLKRHISNMCKARKIVVFIDEVDKTSNNLVFLYFLGTLRDKYLKRNKRPTFHSVILAGVTDIKNIKYQMVKKGMVVLGINEGSHNSPWNIAADFEVDMSFPPADIATMLCQYETDHRTGMDVAAVSQEIYNYTSGYPFLVSRICQHIDGKLLKDWTINGVQAAVKIILKENNTLFDDMIKNMENNTGLYNLLQEMLFTNFTEPNSYRTPEIQLGLMYGILAVRDGLDISNVIFKTIITDYIVEKNKGRLREKTVLYFQNPYIVGDKLDMELVMRKFGEFMYEEYRKADAKFIEQNGRLLFLSFLKPIINGHGFTFVETETRLLKRMDIVVVFGCQQFVIELKLWYGDIMHNKAYEQILGYMDSRNLDEGYLLTFDFRHDANKERKAEWIRASGKRIFDVIV